MAEERAAEPLMADFGVVTGASSPRRLSEATRRLAARALAGEFGRQMRPAAFAVDEMSRGDLSPDRRYALVVRAIAERAPLRVVEGERLAGAATLVEAAQHMVPASPFPGTSHTTIGLERGLRLGYRGLRRQIEERLARGDLDAAGRDFLESMLLTIEAAGLWHRRHIEALEALAAGSAGDARAGYEAVLAGLRRVPEEPAESFREAVQSLWFLWAFQRLCGNWSGLGRIDQMLRPYLERDLAAGRLTRDEARELLAHFWIKGCEWIGVPGASGGSGDAQFYQNVVLAGVDAEGREVTNEVTWLILDVVEELHISDLPVAVRINSRTPDRLWRRIAEVQRRGGGIVSIYHEELILRALERFGYGPQEARGFTNDGCWEILIPGRTAFTYCPFDVLRVLQIALGLGPDETQAPEAADFEALYRLFLDRLRRQIEALQDEADGAFSGGPPSPLLSIFVDDCIEKARGYHDRGARYSVRALHAGGLPDAANSLLALKALVYDERRFSLQELVAILRCNWEGHETLRRQIQRQLRLYGNDDPPADAMMRRLYDDYVALASAVRERAGVLRPPGISTFGREIEYRLYRAATAFGRHQGDILATNLAPTPGSDARGPTAVIRSFCRMDFEKLPNGVPLELKVLPDAVKGEAGLLVLTSLLRTFIALGGFYLHIDVVDTELLRDAQRHPDRYPNLCVRVSGWSARFATLGRPWQDMIIQRTQQR